MPIRCCARVQMKVTRWATQILNRGMAQADERAKLESDAVTGVEALKTQARTPCLA